MTSHETIADLKRHIRGQLNMAAARGQIDGMDALAILQAISAEFVAQVRCDDYRRECVDAVVQCFPEYVERERERLATEGMTRQ